ncbi:MAG: putative polysaccharide biosynthesis protein [Halothermotrichaceae bacterium]
MGEGSSNRGKSFLKGATILTAAGITAKFLGFFVKIALSRIIGSDGYGYYYIAYPVYATLLVVSRSGIPVSLAKLISAKIAVDERKTAFNIFRIGRYLSIIIGLFFSLLLFLLAKPYSLINEPDAYYAIVALSPAIFFVAIMATYRGFFQGMQNMVPTAISQVIEQIVRVTTMIILSYLLLPYGIEVAAAGATFGAVTGSCAGLLVLFYIYYKKKQKIRAYVNAKPLGDINSKKIIKDIFSLVIPITFGALVLPLMNLVDSIIVPNRLEAAGFIQTSVKLFGDLGFAMALVNFPTIITVSLAVSLVPSISEAKALNNDKLVARRTEAGFRLAVLMGLPAAVGLFLMSKPLANVIYGNIDVAVPLQIVAWGVLFIALQQTSAAILQGMGKPKIPAVNLLIGALINAFINYTLTAQPQFGIRGAAFGTVTGFAVAAFLNLIYVKKLTKFRLKIKSLLLKPILAVFVMGIIVNQGFALINNILASFTHYSYTITTFLIVLLAVITYFLLLLISKEIKYNDLILIPKYGRKLANILKRIGLVSD